MPTDRLRQRTECDARVGWSLRSYAWATHVVPQGGVPETGTTAVGWAVDHQAICIVQFHICNFKLWGLQNAVLKSFLVFLGPNDPFLAFFFGTKRDIPQTRVFGSQQSLRKSGQKSSNLHCVISYSSVCSQPPVAKSMARDGSVIPPRPHAPPPPPGDDASPPPPGGTVT